MAPDADLRRLHTVSTQDLQAALAVLQHARDTHRQVRVIEPAARRQPALSLPGSPPLRKPVADVVAMIPVAVRFRFRQLAAAARHADRTRALGSGADALTVALEAQV